MEEKPQFGALTLYRSRGGYLRRLEQFEKAKASYDLAFKTAPEDVRLLIGRSQVCADAMRPMQAYADAEAALKVDPTNMNARNVQACAMYTMSDFERAVVMNYRGARLRRQPPYFCEGIIQGLETIQDCVGINAGDVMIDFLPIIQQEEAKRAKDDDEIYVPRKHISRIPRPESVKKMTQWAKYKHETLARVLAMKYLGPMASDKFFLKELQDDRRIASANKIGSKDLQELTKEAYQSLCERQEMLRVQRPYYSIKYAERTDSKYLGKVKERQLLEERAVGAQSAEGRLRQIMNCIKDLRIKDMMTNAERMQEFLDSKTPHTLPDKDVYIERLYRLVGEGYLVQHRLSYRLSEASNRRRIAFLMGLPISRPKSFDSVMAKFPYKFIDLDLAIDRTMKCLDECENAFMRCWLCYEMSRLLNKKKAYALAKFYAKRCQRQADEIDSVVWWLNGCFALLSGEMQQGNQNDVRIAVEEACAYAKNMKDPERTQAFLEKCLEMVSETPSADEYKHIRQRENQILQTMDEVSKVETRVLFKRMATMPGGRQFSVLPRRKEPSHGYVSERTKRKQRGLTVVPGTEKALPRMPKSKVLGFQIFDI